MKIVIDLQAAQGLSRFRGIGRYSLALAQAMVRLGRGQHEFVIVLNGMLTESIDSIRAAFEGLVSPENIRVWQGVAPTTPLEVGNSWRRNTSQLARERFIQSLNPDIVHVTSLFEGVADNAVHSIGLLPGMAPTAVTFYDLIPLIEREKYLAPNINIEKFYLEVLAYLRNADVLLAISESSKVELSEHLDIQPEKIFNISAATEPHFKPITLTKADERKIRAQFELTRPFVMYSGATDERKNHRRLIEAFSRLPPAIRQGHQLAIVGKISDFDRETFLILIDKCGLKRNEVIITGQVTDDELVQLYNLCSLFVFASWHEGFGLPALEAMSCGAPVIGANTTSLPEVIGCAKALFDPFDTDAISAKIADCLADKDFLKELRRHGLSQAKKFSWDESARRALAAVELFHAKRTTVGHSPLPSRRRRMAFVSPLPPERTGIADYSAELIPDLSMYYDLYIITPQPVISSDWIKLHCTVKSVEWFKENFDRFDRVLYQFGNSPFHSHMFDLLKEKPGVVVLHDFYLSGALSQMGIDHIWPKELYHSHGYKALKEMVDSHDTEVQISNYPCNSTVIENALGVISHSEYARELAKSWVGNITPEQWSAVPLPRDATLVVEKAEARKTLGLDSEAFIICSFGLLDPVKQNKRLLDAWLASLVSKQKLSHLIFVGQNHGGDYGAALTATIKKSGLTQRIRITGWTDAKQFQYYLAAADVGVQLRTNSRGETSASVLDCMKYGLPTIVNANGSMAALPSDAVWMLPDEFEDAELVSALTALWEDPKKREALGRRARKSIIQRNSPKVAARNYTQFIETCYAREQQVETFYESLSTVDEGRPQETDILALAQALSENAAPPKLKRLFVDVSALINTTLRTGIERVVVNILMQLLQYPPAGFRVEPVYANEGTPGYRYAREFTLGLIKAPTDLLIDEPIDAQLGDIFLGLDLQQNIVSYQADYFARLRSNGVELYFVIYDLLPVIMPEAFPEWSQRMHSTWLHAIQVANGAVCISQAVADEMAEWMAVFGASRARPFHIGWFHLGADIAKSRESNNSLDFTPSKILDKLSKHETFLMVGTIEPRKGYLQTIAAFELLWKEGSKVNLVIVGEEGWKTLADSDRRTIPLIVQKLQSHAELNRRLFWLRGVEDEELEQLYARSKCLIMASEGEGFGLPIVEAAKHKLPIIARDIPVFREIAGERATYFSGSEANTLAFTLREWLSGRQTRTGPENWLTWQQSASDLLDVILQGKWYRHAAQARGRCYYPGDGKLFSETGTRVLESIHNNRKEGYLIFGPFVTLPAGKYVVVVHGTMGKADSGQIIVDVTANKSEVLFAQYEILIPNTKQRLATIPICLDKTYDNIEFRVWASDKVDVAVSMIEVRKI